MASEFEPSADSLLPVIQAVLEEHDAFRRGWCIRPQADPSPTWIRLTHNGAVTPPQGWKLHISAGLPSAHSILRRALPVLLAGTANFKVAASRRVLHSLNSGNGGLSQIGKFITVYPCDDREAVRLAVALDHATRGLRGPAVPSDHALSPGSLVHYRYGAFREPSLQLPIGDIVSPLRATTGELIPDRRTPSFRPPDWVADPFVAAGLVAASPPHSPLIAGRYLILAMLHRSPRGSVHRGIDLDQQRECVLKRAARDAQLRDDGRDARDILRREFGLLARLAPDPRFPAVYDLVEHEGDLVLVMEPVSGQTLERSIVRANEQGVGVPGEHVVAWGREVTGALAALHETGMVYRDLKATNVIVAPDGHLHLIDFGLACDIGSAGDGAWGTRGYCSPQQAAGSPAAFADDVYSLGALLYFAATGANPGQAPRPQALLERSVATLSPGIGPDLADVIARCLAVESTDRFPSMQSVETALARIAGHASVVPPRCGETAPATNGGFCDHYRQLARQLGDRLCAMARPAPHGGVVWPRTAEGTTRVVRWDLGSGCAGPVLALAELVREFDDPSHREMAMRGAQWLCSAPRLGGAPLAGLYAGEAGISAALLRAGQVLGERELLAAAAERGKWVAAQPFGSPDLFHGTAGRLRLHLWLWDETADPVHLAAARHAGDALVTSARKVAEDGLGWSIPEGFGNLSGQTLTGYAHGAAGIGDVLLDLWQVTGDERYRETARAAGVWLVSLAVPALADGAGRNWPAIAGARPARGFWCHGAAGIGRFLLHLAALHVLPEADDLATRAASTVARGYRWCGPGQCHGLAGNIEFLLDAFRVTCDPAHLAEARSLAVLLEAYATAPSNQEALPWEGPVWRSVSYLHGLSGLIPCLLRLADPCFRPHQLSRTGFGLETQGMA